MTVFTIRHKLIDGTVECFNIRDNSEIIAMRLHLINIGQQFNRSRSASSIHQRHEDIKVGRFIHSTSCANTSVAIQYGSVTRVSGVNRQQSATGRISFNLSLPFSEHKPGRSGDSPGHRTKAGRLTTGTQTVAKPAHVGGTC